MREPHFVRFARALALVTGLAGVSVTVACGDDDGDTPPPPPADMGGADASAPDAGDTDAGDTDAGDTDAGEADAGGTDAEMADAGEVIDSGPKCDECSCDFSGGGGGGIPDAGLPICEGAAAIECCPAVGPLSPPDLPV
jgi:hypothetical protein